MSEHEAKLRKLLEDLLGNPSVAEGAVFAATGALEAALEAARLEGARGALQGAALALEMIARRVESSAAAPGTGNALEAGRQLRYTAHVIRECAATLRSLDPKEVAAPAAAGTGP